jgi:hypothetical protein
MRTISGNSVSTRPAKTPYSEPSFNNMPSTPRGRGEEMQAHVTSSLDGILHANHFDVEDISTFVLESQTTSPKTARTARRQGEALRDCRETTYLSQHSDQPGVSGTDETPADVDFPHSAKIQIHYACVYLVMYAKRAKSSLVINSSVKTYQTLDTRTRNLFSALRFERPQGSEPLSKAEYFKRTDQVLQKLSNEGGVDHEKKPKHCLGRDDCLDLIECDVLRVVKGNHPLDVTLSHHLLWCSGLLTRIRAGSLVGNTDEVHLETALLT